MKFRLNKCYFWLTLTFFLIAPKFYDTYNALNFRALFDCFFTIPFMKAAICYFQLLQWHNTSWLIDNIHPPASLLFVLPAWIIYRLTNSEFFYQLFFKLPFFIAYFSVGSLIKRYLSPKERRFNYLLFLFNPLVMLGVFIFGSHDFLTTLFLILAYILFNQTSKSKKYLSAFILGLVSATRWYPTLLFPIYLFHDWNKRNYNRFFYLSIFSIPLIFNFLPYILIPDFLWAILKNGMPKGGPIGLTIILRFLNFYVLKIPNLVSQIDFFSKIVIILAPFIVIKMFVKVELGLKILATLIIFFIFSPTIHIFYLVPLLPWIYYYKIKSLYFIWLPVYWWALTVNGLAGLRGWYYFSYPFFKTNGEPFSGLFNNYGVFFSWNTFIVSLLVIIMLLAGFWELINKKNA